jgi:HlyD family secretion protein
LRRGRGGTVLANVSLATAMIPDTSAQDRPIAAAPRGWRRRLPLALVAVAAIVAIALAAPTLHGMLGNERSVSAARLVVATVERGPFVRDVAGEGRVVAAFAPTVVAPHAGTAELHVHAGDSVTTQQVLATIASPDLTSRLAQERSAADAMRTEALRAEVDARQRRGALHTTAENARIDLVTAENDLARQQRAFDAGAVSGMQVDRARDTLEKARIASSTAKSAQGLADESLRFDIEAKKLAHQRQLLVVADLERQVAALSVRSPIDGQVGQVFVAERASVAADAQLLTVVDLSALEVQMQVPESFARDLAIGMPGEIGGNGRTWKAAVSSISPEVVQGLVAARLRFVGETPQQLRQNQRLTVRVLMDRRDGVLMVRRGPFVEESGGAWAYRVIDGVAEKVAVRLGASSTSHVEVLSGLNEGDRVVVSGADAFAGATRVAISR